MERSRALCDKCHKVFNIEPKVTIANFEIGKFLCARCVRLLLE